MSEELAKNDETAIIPSDVSGLFDLKENMEGIEARLPQIGIIHQAQQFKMPDGSKKESITGIILDISRANAFWKNKMSEGAGGGNPPDCFSVDGITPHIKVDDPCAARCSECEKNKFESDGGKGKACKNMKRVHILMDGTNMPLRLSIPPSNLKAVDVYASLLASQGIPYQLVDTVFSLKSSESSNNIEYSIIELRRGEKIINDKESAQKIKDLKIQWHEIMRGQAIGDSEGE